MASDIEKVLTGILKKLEEVSDSIKQILAQLDEQKGSGETTDPGSTGSPGETTEPGGPTPGNSSVNSQELLHKFITIFRDLLDLFEASTKDDESQKSDSNSTQKIQARQKEPILA